MLVGFEITKTKTFKNYF